MYKYKSILDQISSYKFNFESKLFDVLKELSSFSSLYGKAIFDDEENIFSLKSALKNGWHYRHSCKEYNLNDAISDNLKNGYFKASYPSFYMDEEFWNKSIVPVVNKIKENINYFNENEVLEYLDNLFRFIYFSTTSYGSTSFSHVVLNYEEVLLEEFKGNPSFLQYFKDVVLVMEYAYHKYHDLKYSKIISSQYFLYKMKQHYENCYQYPQINPKSSLILIGIGD